MEGGGAKEDRFAKTAVGWILRGLSKHDEDGVREFVEKHPGGFSIEAISNAVKCYDEKERKRYVQMRKMD